MIRFSLPKYLEFDYLGWRDQFIDYWIRGNMLAMDLTTQIYTILKQPYRTYLAQDDFKPVLRELLSTHPGLEFLQSTPEFQERYAETVIHRIFYYMNRSGNGRLTLRELKRGNLIDAMLHVDEEEDINKVLRYFSYEHFYVIYCKFWELDTDHDFFIDRENLIKYGNHSLTYRIVDRIFSQVPRKFTSKVEGKMNYEDFVYFILAEEDKSAEPGLEYCRLHSLLLVFAAATPAHYHQGLPCGVELKWRLLFLLLKSFMHLSGAWSDLVGDLANTSHHAFWCRPVSVSQLKPNVGAGFQNSRVPAKCTLTLKLGFGHWWFGFKCIDLDGNGVLTPNEMQFFYEEQLHRMECMAQEPVLFEDILCQIVDMIGPENEGYMTLRDVKGSKLSGNVFNILFNLNKFIAFETRDPFLIRQEREDPNLTEWDRFAHREYIRLSMEEDGEDMSNASGDVWEESLEAPF
ncbi:hypothetical protein VNO80_15953 [Phaseolus coccineus]|uniref:EF-hand domain-containing protein n=1 Tax=Phaseolus coccineus TaxID=3886 RepID=A0AAN9MSC3_PHACN